MINLIGKLLSACAGFSWTWEFGVTSLIFFGESEYPSIENDDN